MITKRKGVDGKEKIFKYWVIEDSFYRDWGDKEGQVSPLRKQQTD